MTIRYNAKAAEAESSDRLPPGRYLCRVEDSVEKTTKSGDPMVSLRWEYVYGGFTVCFDNLVFNDKGRGIAHKKLKAMGYKIPGDGHDVELEASDLIGMECYLTLVEKEYQGKKNLTPDFKAEGFGYEACGGDAKAKTVLSNNPSDKGFDDDIPF